MELADAAWSLQCAETTNKIFAESRTCECGRRYGQTESNDSEANFTQSALSLTGADDIQTSAMNFKCGRAFYAAARHFYEASALVLH